MKYGFVRLALIAFCSVALFACKTKTKAIAATSVVNEGVRPSKSEKKSLYKRLEQSNLGSVEKTIALYHQLKKDSFDVYRFESDRDLNQYGYFLLQGGKIKDAIEIFKLLVSEFPDNANAYDSLGEAYMKYENKKLALLNYEKSLQLNPKNNHAIDQITILKGLELLVTDWGKEFFHFPLHFAEDIPYQGVEEVVFPKGWIKPDSSDFWSYVFVWALENEQEIIVSELEANLKLYFDGLLGGLSRTDTAKFTETEIDFERNTNPSDDVYITGKLNIFDGFATQEPLTLNARIYSDYCTEKDQLILLFRFSPQAYDHAVWDLLRTVKVRSTVCEK